jgi:glycerate kinase
MPNMKITIAPDSFKGSLTALEVCEAVADGLAAYDARLECVSVPMADGGEGTVQSLVDATGGQLRSVTVSGPLGEPVAATYGLLGDGATAVIEMAAASGLPLVPPAQRNPLHTTTAGTGELIRAALDAGARQFIIGIGGSATNDAGLGLAAALGARLLDAAGREVSPTGGGLSDLATIDLSGFDDRIAQARFRVACDVDNPLFGPLGAAHVYGPQKGATPEIVARLDDGLRRFAEVARRDLSADIADLPGAGAAGGLGAGLVALCGATLEPGVRIVIETVGLRDRMRGSDLCLTGEGRLDRQTAFGKTPKGVADVARELGVPCVALAGSVALEPSLNDAFAAVFSLCNEPLSLEQAMQPDTARALIAFAAQQAVRCFEAGRAPAT